MSTRRDVLIGLGVGGVAIVGGGAALVARTARDPELSGAEVIALQGDNSVALTCTNGKLTPRAIEGPYYTPGTPLRTDIRNGAPKMAPFILTGQVLDTSCRPIAGAVLDFWQTDDEGNYDNQGYGYRGHQFTDQQGKFRLITVRPTAYEAFGTRRTPHIHVKVQGHDTELLTTQLYMPDVKDRNARDNLYRAGLDVTFAGKEGEAQLAMFNFVLRSA